MARESYVTVPNKFSDTEARQMRREHEEGATVNYLRVKYRTTLRTVLKTLIRVGGTPKARAKREPRERFPGALAVAKSENRKLGDCASTMVAKQSCPDSCAFKNGGCYAQFDQVALHWRRITKAGEGLTPLQLAENEAEAIRAIPAERPLRLHVAGDSTTREGTRLIADACADYVARGQKEGRQLVAWGYTHAADRVSRSDWGQVSVLASCETPADVRRAWERGYAAAITVTEFQSDRAYTLGEGEDAVKCVPCPAQSRGRTCSECRLCHDDQRLLDAKLVIAFSVHGSGAKKAAATLKRVALPTVVVSAVGCGGRGE